jgi:hypothetical protein
MFFGSRVLVSLSVFRALVRARVGCYESGIAAPLRLGLVTMLGFGTSWVVGNGSRGRDPSLDVTFVIFCEKVVINDERA